MDARILDVPLVAPINRAPRLPRFLDSGLPTLILMILGLSLAFLFFDEQKGKETFYISLGLAGFIMFFGLFSRWWQDSGGSARRRMSDD